jgi:hypothetical protein
LKHKRKKGIFISDMAKKMGRGDDLNVQLNRGNRDRCRICMKSLKSFEEETGGI